MLWHQFRSGNFAELGPAEEESIMSKTLMSVTMSVGIAVACVVIFSQNIFIGLLVLLTIVLDA